MKPKSYTIQFGIRESHLKGWKSLLPRVFASKRPYRLAALEVGVALGKRIAWVSVSPAVSASRVCESARSVMDQSRMGSKAYRTAHMLLKYVEVFEIHENQGW